MYDREGIHNTQQSISRSPSGQNKSQGPMVPRHHGAARTGFQEDSVMPETEGDL